MIKKILVDGLKTGAVLSVTTAAAIAIASNVEHKGTWGAINNVAHIVDGDDIEFSNDFSPRHSSIGLAVNTTAMVTWAILYEAVFGRVKLPNSLAAASLLTAGAYVIDYHIVPKRLSPGIEHKVGNRSILAIYGVLALTLAFSQLWKKHRA